MVILLYDNFTGYNEGVITVFKETNDLWDACHRSRFSPYEACVVVEGSVTAVGEASSSQCTCELPLCKIIKNET